MSDDQQADGSERAVTRREAMGGGAAALAAMLGLSTGTASAQAGTEPRIQLGDDWEIDDVDRGDGTTDLELRHLPSGSTFVFDGDSQTATLPELVTDEVRGGVTGGNPVTNLFGDGLEYASGAVQVLSSIWDSANQVITADVDNSSVVTDSVSVESVGSVRHYAGAYSGSDPDARLDSALSAASNGDTVFLESDTYDADRTVSTQVSIVGTGPSGGGTRIEATWTLSIFGVVLTRVYLGGATVINMDGGSQRLAEVNSASTPDINVGASEAIITSIRTANVTFESGASGGIVDSSTDVSVTDNDGGNTTGDIAQS